MPRDSQLVQMREHTIHDDAVCGPPFQFKRKCNVVSFWLRSEDGQCYMGGAGNSEKASAVLVEAGATTRMRLVVAH